MHDIEVLEEELEDANSHQKRYYEALMQKEDQLNRAPPVACRYMLSTLRAVMCPYVPLQKDQLNRAPAIF